MASTLFQYSMDFCAGEVSGAQVMRLAVGRREYRRLRRLVVGLSPWLVDEREWIVLAGK